MRGIAHKLEFMTILRPETFAYTLIQYKILLNALENNHLRCLLMKKITNLFSVMKRIFKLVQLISVSSIFQFMFKTYSVYNEENGYSIRPRFSNRYRK